jgi:BlaI family penicillinase repressor
MIKKANSMDDEMENVSLSDLQLTIMRVLWSQPDISTADVVDALRTKRLFAHTTVATILVRLEKRGLVSSFRQGRQHLYRAILSEAQIQKSMVSDLLSTLFLGDTNALLSHLVKENEIQESDLEKIRLLIESKGNNREYNK